MRIIAGKWGGRRIDAPSGTTTRPTQDRVREGLFSALDARGLIEQARVLDLFAGSGALGLEALSRGAQSLLSIERDGRAAKTLRKNIAALEAIVRVEMCDLSKPTLSARLAQRGGAPRFDLVLMDPPYDRVGEWVPFLLEQLRDLLSEDGHVVVEHRKGDTFTREGYDEVASYRYGDTAISLLRLE